MMVPVFIIITCSGCGEVLSRQLPRGTEENTKDFRIGGV
jgi:uncharacterized protein YceK